MATQNCSNVVEKRVILTYVNQSLNLATSDIKYRCSLVNSYHLVNGNTWVIYIPRLHTA